MTPREAMLAQIHHEETFPVPYELGMEGNVAERLDRHYGTLDWRQRLTQYTVYVPGVQLMRVKLEQNYVCQDSTPDRTNQFGVVRGKPGKSTQQFMLTLDARDSSSNPGDQVNFYKDALMKLNYFKANLDPTNGVKLASLSAPQIGLDAKSFVLFTLECRFTEKTR